MKTVRDVITKPEVSFFMALVVPIVSVACTIAVMRADIVRLDSKINYNNDKFEARVEKVDNKLEENTKAFTDIQVKLAEIQKDLLYIKDKFN